ncbi:unnamed protein product [Heligmosomoides polygyrus]|uniref:DDE-1 domain-containing protein n=1 Tax=Heligmosomoides polygyrus TaxID=6339 RepID=A0A183G906_HELPZ|nr:unnamed protein product [Heligmosomoides polygyrus]
MASILKDFEACQLEVDEDEQLEVVEEQEEDWYPQHELMDVERQASSGHMTGFCNIMRTQTVLSFFEHVFVPQMPDNDIVILDSFAGFSNHVAIQATIPRGKTLSIRTIPSGATGQIQPADVGFFIYMKLLMKRFHSHVTPSRFSAGASRAYNTAKLVMRLIPL